MQAMIFAAGLGTRLYPLTKTLPKALVPYKNKPLLEHVIRKISSEGFNDIIINVHHFADKIIDFLQKNNNFKLKIHISHEKKQLLETGGGLFYASKYFKNKPFLVYNVDILSSVNLKNLYEYHIKNSAIATLAVQNRPSEKRLYFNDKKELCKWKNEKTNEEKICKNCDNSPTPFAFSGIHIISPQIFKFMHNGKYSIIDTYLSVAKTQKITYFDHSDDIWTDMGKPESFKKKIAFFIIYLK